MSDAWYYADKSQQRVGPVPLQQLRDVLAKIPNARDTYVWRDGFPDWKKAGDVAELWPAAAQPPLPPTHPSGQAGFQPDPGRRAASFGNLPDLWLGFNGRANRGKYWLVALVNILILVVVAGLLFSVLPWVAAIAVMGLVYIALFISFLAISIKRLHDRNKPTWWVVIFVVIPMASSILALFLGDTAIGMVLNVVQMVFSIWAFVELGCLRGTVGPNDYGEDPLPSRP
jgi:uncharacterized membrane protein YhaH (DUF805 family)